jgi:hypothetical protein
MPLHSFALFLAPAPTQQQQTAWKTKYRYYIKHFFGLSLLRQKYYLFIFISDFSILNFCASLFGVTIIRVLICHFRVISSLSFTCIIVVVLNIFLLLTRGRKTFVFLVNRLNPWNQFCFNLIQIHSYWFVFSFYTSVTEIVYACFVC